MSQDRYTGRPNFYEHSRSSRILRERFKLKELISFSRYLTERSSEYRFSSLEKMRRRYKEAHWGMDSLRGGLRAEYGALTDEEVSILTQRSFLGGLKLKYENWVGSEFVVPVRFNK